MTQRRRERDWHQRAASWFFGLLLLISVAAVFVYGPNELPLYKRHLLALACALLAGLFAFFITGQLRVKSPSTFAHLALRGTGGMAIFIAILIWADQALIDPPVTAPISGPIQNGRPLQALTIPVPLPDTTSRRRTPDSTGWVASRSGKTYYRASCKGAREITPENVITFRTEPEAQRAGYHHSVQDKC